MTAHSLVFLGDLCLAGRLEDYLLTHPETDLWKGIETLIDEEDVVVANLECNLSSCEKASVVKYATLRADPVLVRHLNRLNVAILANNHVGDYGSAAVEEMLELLSNHGIEYCGYGSNLEQASRPLILDRNGVRTGILSFCCYSTNGFNYATPTSPGVAPLLIRILKNRIAELRPQVDGLFVYLHWGVEQNNFPVIDQMRIARRALEWGADAVLGTHAHVIQPYETKPGFIFYGLGNFIFSDFMAKEHGNAAPKWISMSVGNKQSLAVKFTVSSRTQNPKPVQLVNVWPLQTGDDFVPGPISPDSLTMNLSRLNSRAAKFAWLNSRALRSEQEIQYVTKFNGDLPTSYYLSPHADLTDWWKSRAWWPKVADYIKWRFRQS